VAHVELENGSIRIESEFREKELIKTVPGTRWDNNARVWRCPLSWASCVALRGVFGKSLTVGPDLAIWALAERDGRVAPCLVLRASEDAEGNEKLYPFQRVGVAFLKAAGSALLADEMGTGKTVQAIVTLQEQGAWPALIVCPNSMKRTWFKELEKWAPEVSTIVLESGLAARHKALEAFAELVESGAPAALVVNWEALRLHTRLAGYGSIRLTDEEKEKRELNAFLWEAIVADECHRAKDPKAKQTRALWGVSAKAKRRIALTGTPVANSPLDLWSIMHFCSPEEWASRTRWVDRYALQSWNNFGGMDIVGLKSEHRDELFSYLDPRFLRRPKEAVLPDLPPKTYAKRYIELGSKQRKAYNQLRKEMIVELESGVLVASHPLQRLTRLVQFASAYGEMVEDGLRLTEPSCKVDALEEIAEELGGKQAIVFAESRQLIELAATRLHKLSYTCSQITGSVSPADRQANVDNFQAGETQFILATLGAGGEGITLTAADTTIFLQRSFSSVKNSQAEDRNHRIGQDRPVEVIDIIAADTIEEHVHEIMLGKQAKLEEVARDEATIKQWLS